MRQQLIDTARTYTGDGISITLTDDRKVSIGSWKDFQSRLITDKEIQERSQKASGIAIICGSISGGLEVIDIDLKYDLTGTLYKRLMDAIPDVIADKLVTARTKSGGVHFYYRVASVHPNIKLARRHVSDTEASDNPHVKVMVLIETRGEGGYVVAPPTSGYVWENGNHTNIETLSIEERDELFDICRSFNEYLEEPARPEQNIIPTSNGLSPVDDYNQRGDIIDLLTRHGWTVNRSTDERIYFTRPGKKDGISGDWLRSKRWFSVFTTSSPFEPNKAYNASAVFNILENKGDWKQTVKRLSSDGYGMNEREVKRLNRNHSMIRSLYDDGLTDDQVNREVQKRLDMTRDEATEIIQTFHQSERDESTRFWTKDNKDKILINKTRLINFLTEQGFRMMPYDTPGNDCRLVMVKDNIIEESSTEKIKKVTYEYVKANAGDDAESVSSAVLDRHHLFGESFLEFLPRISPDFINDTRDAAYFTFNNNIVKVTADSVTMETYGQINRHIWKSHINPFDIEVFDMSEFELDFTNPHCDIFPKFLFYISGQDDARFHAVCSHVGYLLHKFKDPTIPVAIILAEETDNDAKGGGTGKGIFVNAISHMIQTETIDGKNFRLDKSFAFQRVGLDTKMVAIQDVRSKVDFEGFYSIITEGITIEKKGQQEIHIPYSQSPKILFTTNYSIPSSGNHAQRRQRVIPFSDYFSPKHTPLDEFKHQLFSDWDRGQWVAFYNFMFFCCRLYLTKGLIEIPTTDTMKLKSIKNQFGKEFREWFENYLSGSPDQWTKFADMYHDFLSQYEMSEKEFSRKRFRASMATACDIFGLTLQTTNRGSISGMHYKVTKDQKKNDVFENNEISKVETL